MDINQNTQHINTFSGGMNSDTTDAMLSNNQYKFAFDLRYISSSTNKNGSLQAIKLPREIASFGNEIIAVTQVRDTPVVMFRHRYEEDTTDIWYTKEQIPVKAGVDYFYIVRLELDEDNYLGYKMVFGPCEDYVPSQKLSIETRYEDRDLQKIYIADGVNPIISMNIMKYNGTQISVLHTLPSITFSKFKFDTFIQGALPASTVQYSYQLYKKYGRESLISPPTKKLDIVDISYTNKYVDLQTPATRAEAEQYTGVLQRKHTNCGVQLNIDIEYNSYFDSIKVYRISQYSSSESPEVDLIIDGPCKAGKFVVKDVGLPSLEKLDLSLYNSISGVHIIPRVIKQKNNILFASNLKEQQFTIDAFENFDARAYSFDNTGICHMFNEVGDVKLIDGTHESAFIQTARELPYEYCINKGNDINEMYLSSSEDGNNTQQAFATGKFDRFALPTNDGWGSKLYGGSGLNVSWKFTIVPLIGDASGGQLDDKYKYYGSEYNTNTYGKPTMWPRRLTGYYVSYDGQFVPYNDAFHGQPLIPNDWDFFDDFGNRIVNTLDYSNPRIAMSFKSLRRDEVYRYGIVLYDKFGNRSSVRWIADIRVPNMYIPGFQTFDCKSILPKAQWPLISEHEYDDSVFDELTVNSIGIQFTVQNLPKECVSYEIVRADRTVNDIATISQGVVARPLQPVFHRYDNRSHEHANMLMPTGLLTTQRVWHGDVYHAHTKTTNGTNVDTAEASNYRNGTIYQFVSPEMSYQKDSTFELLKAHRLEINPQIYVFGATGFKGYVHDKDTKTFFARVNGGSNYSEDRDGASKIHPAVTNCNLLLAEHKIGMFDVSKNKEGTIEDHTKNINKPINDRHSIFLSSYFYWSTFHAIRGSNTFSGYDFNNSCTAPSYTSVGDRVLAAQTSIVHDNQGPIIDFMRRDYCYIKLYNKSSKVYLRGHYNDIFDQDCYYDDVKNEFFGYPAIAQPTYNKCPIEEIKNSTDFSWDDFVDMEEKVKYAQKYTNIGNYNYCNWAAGARFNNGINSMTVPLDYETKQQHSETNLFGPAGSCLIFSIQNRWKINNVPFWAREGNRKSYLFSDTIGTGQYEHIDLVKDTSKSIPYNIQVKHKVSHSRNVDNGSHFSSENEPYVPNQEPRGFNKNEILTIKRIDNNETLWYTSLISDSIAGTYISNIRKQTVPYGGQSWQSIQNSKYYSSGDIFKVIRDNGVMNKKSNSPIVFNGDCYIVPFEYTSLHKFYSPRNIPMTMNITYCIPVETNINTTRNAGITLSNDFEKYANMMISNIQREPSNVSNLFQQNKPEYSYNSVYSSPNRTMLHLSLNNLAKSTSIKKLDYRTRYSNPKVNKESSDSWLIFKAANYLDVDGQFGEITQLELFQDNLIFFQTNAVGRFAVNDRVALQDTNSMQIALGNGGVLDRYDYITQKNGLAPGHFSSITTNSALYWYDYNRAEILRFTPQAGLQVLSKEKNVQNYINMTIQRGVVSLFHHYSLLYDKKFDEIYFNINLNKSLGEPLIFNEHTQQFTGVYSFPIIGGFTNDTNNYVAYYNKICRLNDGEIAPRVSVEFIANPHPNYTKVFDTQKISMADVIKLQPLQIELDCYTDLHKNIHNSPKFTRQEGDLRYALPRTTGTQLGKRVRGKTLCESLTFTNNKDALYIDSIITKYRISWS